MAAKSSQKPAVPTVPPADLTKDIDDEWADDDDETGGVPTVTASPSTQPSKVDAESGSRSGSGSSDAPKAKRSISGTLPAQPSAAQDSEAPATDEIDSDWPDEVPAVAAPQIPKHANVPDLDRKLDSSPAESRPTSTNAPSTVPPTSANFERAAARLAKESAFSESIAPNQASQPPPGSASEHAGQTKAGDAHAVAKDAAASGQPPPRRAGGDKKRSPVVGIAVAAAAVALVGFALKSTRSAQSEAEPVAHEAAPTKTVVRPAKDPEAKAPPGEPAKEEPASRAGDGTESEAAAGEPDEAADEAKPAGKVLVHLAVSPEDAEIYQKGQPLGRGQIRVKVDPEDKAVLLLVKEGYWPRKVILDGTQQYVNVGMRKKPEEAAPAAQPQPAKVKAAPAPAKKKPAPARPPSPSRPPAPRGGPPAQGAAPSIAR